MLLSIEMEAVAPALLAQVKLLVGSIQNGLDVICVILNQCTANRDSEGNNLSVQVDPGFPDEMNEPCSNLRETLR